MTRFETKIDKELKKGEDTKLFFGVDDLSKVNMNIVLNLKRQVQRRKNYTCENRMVEYTTKNAFCRADRLERRCIDVPLNTCLFVPISTITGKELKSRFVDKGGKDS